MLNLRRLTGLALTAALALASFGATGSPCESHGPASAMSAVAAMSHDGMPMPGDHDSAPAECTACDPAGDPATGPCDHAMDGGCAAMPSCATTPAETQSSALLRLAHASNVVTAPASLPASLTFSPETPPPRA